MYYDVFVVFTSQIRQSNSTFASKKAVDVLFKADISRSQASRKIDELLLQIGIHVW